MLGLIGAIVIGLAGGGAWMILQSGAAPDPPRTQPIRTEAPGDGEASGTAREQLAPDPTLTGDLDAPPEALVVAWDSGRLERFEGRGRLRGTIQLSPSDLLLPRLCTVVLRPAQPFPGGQPPEDRSLAIDAGHRDFLFEDLALGEYELSLEAEGIDTSMIRILLIKPDATDVSVQLVAHAAGVIEGRVVDAADRGAEGLAVLLVSASRGRRYRALTDGEGAFRLASVRHGSYRLCLGSADTPLAPPREVHIHAPLMTMAKLVLPPLGELFVELVDERGEPAGMVPVSGWGKPSGSVSVQTDSRGCALARFVPPGSYTLVAQVPRGKVEERVEVRAGERAEIRLQLSR